MLREVNGYDETTSLGRNLQFIRVSVSKDDELLPFLMNLKHFGSIVVTKRILRGQSEEDRRQFLKDVQESDTIGYDAYIIFMDIQLKLLVDFMHKEFFDLSVVRGELIDAFRENRIQTLKAKVAGIITKLKRFDATPAYIDAFVKSFAYRTVLRDVLQNLPDNQSTTDGEMKHFIDGGYQFSFWGEKLVRDLKDQRLLGQDFETRVYGIANGDEYFPIVNLAGNVAAILNSIPFSDEMHRYRSDPIYVNFHEVEKFLGMYRNNYRKGVFFQRILFIGQIDLNLQYLIPFIQYKNSGDVPHEAFRIRPPLKRFYSFFGGDPRKDLVVVGALKTENDKLISVECKDMGLTMIPISTFKEWVLDFLSDLSGAATDYGFTGHLKRKMEDRVHKIERLIQKTV